MTKFAVFLGYFLFFTVSTCLGENKELADLFSLSEKTVLQDPQLKFVSVGEAKISPKGQIIVVKFIPGGKSDSAGLRVFTEEGQLKRVIPPPPPEKKGRITKESFWDCLEDEKGWIFANSPRYFFVYDSSGRLQTSYSMGSENVKRIEDVWGSNVERVDWGPNGKIAGVGVGYPIPNYLYVYDKKGSLLKQFFLLDSVYANSNLKIHADIDVDSMGDIWCTYSAFYKVFRYGMDGTRKKDIVGKSPVFTPPDSVRSRSSFPSKKWLRWLKTWTPVVDCAATQSGYVLLVLLAGEKGKPFVKNFDPEGNAYAGGFFIDVYDREGNMIAGGLHTPHRFLSLDDKDNLWFALAPETPENPAKDGPAVLGKFRLNLKPVGNGEAASKTAR